jgi:diacylglycerol kinase (ATP)
MIGSCAMEAKKNQNATSLKGERGIARILNATRYSIMGFRAAFVNESAFRQLVFLNLILQPTALVLNIAPVERAILMLVPLLSLAIELLNTAIENVVDRISMDIHPLSKAAKDMGSAAQFVALTMIVVVWSVVLL